MSQPERPTFSISRVAALLERLLRPWKRPHRPAPDPVDRRDDPDRAKVRVQAELMRRALDGDVAAAAADGRGRAEDDADAAYFFRPSRALIREDRFGEVAEFFGRRSEDFDGEMERVEQEVPVPGLVPVRLPARRDGEDDVLRTLEELEAEVPPDRDGRPAASPDHVLYVVNKPSLCPATEPDHPPTDVPVPHFEADPGWGDGIRVSVVDTGLWMDSVDTTPWLKKGVEAEVPDQEDYDPHHIPPYGGHGTFVAGVIRRAAPRAHIQVQGALVHGGAEYEADIVEQLHQAYVEGDDPQLISISAGTHSRGDFPLIAFDALMEALGARGVNPLLIAAAGNDYGDKPFWPAAFSWAVGVGSVDPDGSVSDYSNIGPWVKVYARGRDHVNAFPTGTYACYEPANVPDVRTFSGLAQWSGTSFATPVVTGLVAAEMTRTGNTTNPRAAYASVVAAGVPGTDRAGNPITIVGPLT